MAIFSAVGAHGQITALTTSAQNISAPGGANSIWVQPLAQNVRVRVDGVTAQAATGFQLLAGMQVVEMNVGGAVLSLAAETSTAVVEYQWLRF